MQNSTITGGGKVSLQAVSESGSLQARAATVQGKEVSLSAHTLDLGAQETHASHTSQDQSSGWTAGVTYHGGMAFSYDASISMSEGRAEGQSTQQHNTHIRATEGVSFSSTGDTSLKGARIEGETVKAEVSGNLSIESLQDTATARAQQSSSGLNFSYGAQGSGSAQGTNAGANFSQGRASGSYAVVTEQSGIAAGQGGFEIDVGGTTHLKGGLIDSTASADKNSLSTGQLITQDIANHSEFRSSTFGLSLSYSSNPKETGNLGNGFNAMPDIPQFESRDDRSTTRSAIAAGSVQLTQGDQKENEQQLASLNRDVETERNKKALDPLPDLQKTLKNQSDAAMAIRVAGPALYGMVGDIAQSRYEKAVADYDKAKASGDTQGMQQAQQEMQAWSEGGVGKIALHGAAGAMLGNVPGMIAAASNETLIPYLQQQAAEKYPYPEGADAQTKQEIDRQRSEYMLLGSTVIGAATGGVAGANVANTGTKFNYLNHRQWVELAAARSRCNGDSQCVSEVDKAYVRLSQAQDAKLATCESRGDCDALIAEVRNGNETQQQLIGSGQLDGFAATPNLQSVGNRLAADPTYRAQVNRAVVATYICQTNPAQCDREAMNAALLLGTLVTGTAAAPVVAASVGRLAVAAGVAVETCVANLVLCANRVGLTVSDILAGEALGPGAIAAGAGAAGTIGRRTTDALRVGEYKYTRTAGNHINDVVTKGDFKGELARPYLTSPNTINQILVTGRGIADPGGVPGALRYDVPGNFRGNVGVGCASRDQNNFSLQFC